MQPMFGLVAQVRIFCLFLLCCAAVSGARPLEMKFLVLTATGSEPSFLAIQSALDHLGTPYQAVALANGQALPPLQDGDNGLFQAVILATGNLGVCDPTCRTALSAQDWARLDAYSAAFSVRTVGFYTYPDPRFGMKYVDGVFSPIDGPATLEYTEAAAAIFPYLRRDSPLKIAGAFAYLADSAPASGETTTPLLRLSGRVVAALHTKADGREYLALTFDHSPALRHSLELAYGVISWAAKGVMLGSRRIYLNPQSDDLFLPNNLFTSDTGPCGTSQFIVNPTAPLAPNCPKIRITDVDLANLRNWQSWWTSQPQTSLFRTTLAYNGLGAKTDADDPLTAEARRSLTDFFWVNHTYTHKILDCYAVNADGSCRPANYDESLSEVNLNFGAADRLEIPVDRTALVTPAVSGLGNTEFLRAAADAGIRYLVSDTSRPEGIPKTPNTGIHPDSQPGLLFIPRRATNIFYNTATAVEGADGSLTDEYNLFFGPDGIMRIGGPDGRPFFSARQSYDQIIDRESEALLTYMWRHEKYLAMFHQSNFNSYQDGRSLYSDTIDATLRKFTATSTLPVVSVIESEAGKLLDGRMGWLASNARVVLHPGESITIKVEKPAIVPITGVCADGCEEYGGEWQSRIPVTPEAPVTLLLQ